MRKSAYITALIFLVFAGVVLYIEKAPGKLFAQATETATPAPSFLIDLPEKDIEKVVLTGEAGVVEIGRDDKGLWKMNNPTNPAIDLGTLEMHITTLLDLEIGQTLQNQVSDSILGFDHPTLVIEITMKDGSINKYEIGGKTPIDTDYYARKEGNQPVLLNQNIVSSVTDLITQSYATPTPSPEPVTSTESTPVVSAGPTETPVP
jgi:hypothetical protein